MRTFFSIFVFLATLIMMAIAGTLGWELLIKNHLYNCTDDFPLDFLQPGNWVHHPDTVTHVSGGRSMSEPDQIKQGWTITGLWALWLAIVLGSLAISYTGARWSWTLWSREPQEKS